MYDMPDTEIIGFWGKRPFIGKAFPKPQELKDRVSLKLPALLPVVQTSSGIDQPITAPVSSWHDDPTLIGRRLPIAAANAIGEASAS